MRTNHGSLVLWDVSSDSREPFSTLTASPRRPEQLNHTLWHTIPPPGTEQSTVSLGLRQKLNWEQGRALALEVIQMMAQLYAHFQALALLVATDSNALRPQSDSERNRQITMIPILQRHHAEMRCYLPNS